MRRMQVRSVTRHLATRRRQGVLLAAVVALLGALLHPVPVATQALVVEAPYTDDAVSLDDPWASIWERAPEQEIALSAQNIAPPFGGGTVQSLSVRAMNDGTTLYMALEWPDEQPDDAVSGVTEFSDAVALQFPGSAATALPPFTMGAAGAMVNIWQWKAVWQTDLEAEYQTVRDRYPNMQVDLYPNDDDSLYDTASYVGNPIARAERQSPVENLIAEGFGTLTHAESQDVRGVGAWQDGRWRVVFARALAPADPSHAAFTVGEPTNVAFAVWDGGQGDRNGQKSIAQFVQLSVGDESTSIAAAEDDLRALWLPLLVAAVALAIMAVYLVKTRRPGGGEEQA